jgi:hypothetical protein
MNAFTFLTENGKFNNSEIMKHAHILKAWKIQCKLPPKTKRFCPLVLK